MSYGDDFRVSGLSENGREFDYILNPNFEVITDEIWALLPKYDYVSLGVSWFSASCFA
jgi:hypothetical protein